MFSETSAVILSSCLHTVCLSIFPSVSLLSFLSSCSSLLVSCSCLLPISGPVPGSAPASGSLSALFFPVSVSVPCLSLFVPAPVSVSVCLSSCCPSLHLPASAGLCPLLSSTLWLCQLHLNRKQNLLSLLRSCILQGFVKLESGPPNILRFHPMNTIVQITRTFFFGLFTGSFRRESHPVSAVRNGYKFVM